jgi:large subunit ribosomal protein L29
MKSRELRALNDAKLLELYDDKKQSLYMFRQQKVTGELKDTTAFRRTRREIARILTILRERQLAADVVKKDS